MKILKPGKVEQRKFVCSVCGCVFAADRADVRYSVGTEYVVCPCCETSRNLTWKYGEPHEEPTQDARMDSNRLARILFAMPMMDDCNSMADYLIQRGVTFREG